MGVLDIVSYWWPGIAALFVLVLPIFAPGLELVVWLALLVLLIGLQLAVVMIRGGRFIWREAKARSKQD